MVPQYELLSVASYGFVKNDHCAAPPAIPTTWIAPRGEIVACATEMVGVGAYEVERGVDAPAPGEFADVLDLIRSSFDGDGTELLGPLPSRPASGQSLSPAHR